jgi:O-acetyl-ADP-ribose deacetylase (regulator of RNase III)
MIQYVKGNLLEAPAHALVNTVNTVGVMGKGIALQFKETFPVNFKLYADASKKGQIVVGKMFVVRDALLDGEKIIINFPTKTEWYRKSQYSFIEEGLQDLVRVIASYEIHSIAIPPLGCGNGGLQWNRVKTMMEKYLADVAADVFIYEPNEKVKEILQQEEQKKKINLTPARAMLLYALAKYEERGETPSVFAANKIAYFLQESGEPLKLQFVPYKYGPYAQAVEKVLYALNGKYLTGLEQMNAKAFEPLQLQYERFIEVIDFVHNKLSQNQRDRLNSVLKLIEGFESTLSLEILSSIHFLMRQDRHITIPKLVDQIQSWNDRKKNLIKEEHIKIALQHLTDYGGKINIA